MLRTVIKDVLIVGFAASVKESTEKRLTVGDGDCDGGDSLSSTTGWRTMEGVLREEDSPS